MVLKKVRRGIQILTPNILGWRTKRKILVIESDDWGTIRMHSREAKESFIEKGFDIQSCPYNSYDALECNEDLEKLFETLLTFHDRQGRSPIITANFLSANPDFEKIREAEFKEYFYEPFINTLARYPRHDKVYTLHKKGIELGIMVPQFHGREHLNVKRWLSALRKNDAIARAAFDQQMFTVHAKGASIGRKEYLDAFGGGNDEEISGYKTVISEGINLFKDFWGTQPVSFMAPCFTWPVEAESILFENGIHSIQGTYVQRVPFNDETLELKKRYHYLGQTNRLGQKYLIRNCNFEPSLNQSYDWVAGCLNEISLAFTFNKPAVISMHRVNVGGYIDPMNRDKNLMLFNDLLKSIMKKYPDIEFMSSNELASLMK